MRSITLSHTTLANPLCDLTRVEDYLEVVYDLIQTKGYARAVDIAERLDVKTPSVTNMIQKLNGMGLVVYERYRGLTLTNEGRKMAHYAQRKHALIAEFLSILGIKEKTARLDADGIEHHVHKDTVNRIEHFIKFVNDQPSWFKSFQVT
jgi:Mn-dependent DtxR family transcriptional regulator